MKQGSIRYKECRQGHNDPYSKRNDRDSRYQILGILQDKTRHTATEPEQVL